MKPMFTKRVLSYLVDIIIVFTFVGLLTSLIPISEKAKKINDDIVDIYKSVSEKEINYKTYSKTLMSYNYDLSKETVINTLVTIVIYILYFVIYPLVNKGQTIGKKLTKIKIVNIDKTKKLTTNNMLIREFILHGIIFDLLMIVLILFINKKTYMFINGTVGFVEIIVSISILLMIIIRKDGRGLHDLLGNTIVINEEEVK